MRTRLISFSLLFAICFLFCKTSRSQKDYTKLVNPFIGTGGHGHTYPGASMPFGMMQLSPDTRMADWDGSSGYHYSDSLIYGFSHTHLSGTGIPDYCDVLLMPFTGTVQWSNKDYRSAFSHQSEKASPGYYEVLLQKHGIKAQLTSSYRSGMHQYSFAQGTKEGSILIDLEHRDEVLESWIEKVSDHEIRGLRRSKSWAQNQYVYFCIRFEQPIKKFVVLNDESKEVSDPRIDGKKLKAYVQFEVPANATLKAKVGISGVSAEGAQLNLAREIPHWNFNQVQKAAQAAWNQELGKIDITGGTKEEQTVFYTALYHTFLAPNLYQDVNGQYRGTDAKIHQAKDFTNYTVFSLWDTYRAYHPLMTIINQKRTADWINTFLKQYQHGGMLPVWELSGNETFCMIGYHSVPVIVDAYLKGIRGFDAQQALKAMQTYAESDRFALNQYREQGYISNDREHESVSKTLEYAYDDWCISQLAKALGNDSVYRIYTARAQYWKNVFDPNTKHMRGKLQAIWQQPFDPREINNFFTEGNSWQYSFAVPQDVQSLIKLHGGKEAFSRKLDELFTTSSQTTGRNQADVTGLIGQYAQGNEPSHHMAYLFTYAGKPWRTQELIHKICTEFYTNTPDGLIGNEDCGQMSAWYVMSAMGMYPVNPASGEYILGTPLFDEVNIRLEHGKTFTIKAKREKASSFYISETRLNGKLSVRSFLKHKEVMAGGIFTFFLSNKRNDKWASLDIDIPLSTIETVPIVPEPYFAVASNKFHDSISVSIESLDGETGLMYKKKGQDFLTYTQPFLIQSTDTITAVGFKNGRSSWPVRQIFYKLPADKSITILSKVHPLYTAGGPDALIDSIFGTANWRAGEWQSYFNTDFEAIVDLKKSTPINQLGIHVLQDVSPWILYPKEVIFWGSNDGNTYYEVGRTVNNVELAMNGAQTQTIKMDVKTTARYIKIKAVNAGALPAFHESAGQPSHLFIDEIIIK